MLETIALILVMAALMWVVSSFLQRYYERRADERREIKLAKKGWFGVCPQRNPATNVTCEREEFHTIHHCHDVDGEMVWW